LLSLALAIVVIGTVITALAAIAHYGASRVR
jgi:hypothetical protein